MIELAEGLAPELVPLAWLVGAWEGSGVIEYAVTDDDVRTHAFRQRIDVAVEPGKPYLHYGARLWLEQGPVPSPEASAVAAAAPLREGEGDELPVLASETGYWRLARPHDEGDVGPGYLPATAPLTHGDAEAVERLRGEGGAFEVELALAHPSGVCELYYGQARGPRIDLVTDAVIRAPGAKPHASSSRMYGLVGSELLWAWDIAALGRELASHASGRLAKVG